MSVTVSIIIPVYNRSNYLHMTLESIRKQSICNNKYEVIVVDDGSEERIENVVKQYEKYFKIIFRRKEKNGFGAAAARNIGINNASGDILLFIDNGIILEENAIENHIQSHSLHYKSVILGYVYGFDSTNKEEQRIKQIVDNNITKDSIQIMEEEGLIDTRETMYQKYGDNLNNWIAPWSVCWSCHMSLEKNVIEKVGYFDESYSTWGGEDVDFALAMYVNCVHFILDRECKSIHYPHEKYINTISKEEFKKNNIKKKMYLLNKYPIYSVGKWCKYGMSKLNDCEVDKI
ncbi:MAG: glycosyltransferase family 2 protein [Eubacterium sp.]|nr:glycosyltransferase family 2 protein [Eubacterium sp.]